MNGVGSSRGLERELRIRVLVVEGLREKREQFCRFLGAWNFEAVGVGSSEEAVHRIGETMVSIAVISHRDPSCNGLELVSRLRKAAPEIEAILLSADTSPRFATEAFRVRGL